MENLLPGNFVEDESREILVAHVGETVLNPLFEDILLLIGEGVRYY